MASIIRRTVTQAERPHRNEATVVGPQRGAKVQLENSIRSKEEPVGASTRKHRSAKSRALKVAPRDGDCPASPVGHRADALGRRERYAQDHEQTRVHHSLHKGHQFGVHTLGVRPAQTVWAASDFERLSTVSGHLWSRRHLTFVGRRWHRRTFLGTARSQSRSRAMPHGSARTRKEVPNDTHRLGGNDHAHQDSRWDR